MLLSSCSMEGRFCCVNAAKGYNKKCDYDDDSVNLSQLSSLKDTPHAHRSPKSERNTGISPVHSSERLYGNANCSTNQSNATNYCHEHARKIIAYQPPGHTATIPHHHSTYAAAIIYLYIFNRIYSHALGYPRPIRHAGRKLANRYGAFKFSSHVDATGFRFARQPIRWFFHNL